MPRRGNPQLPIRLSHERRKLWEEAARIDRRTITDFVRQATDRQAEETINGKQKGIIMKIEMAETDRKIIAKHSASVRGRAFIELQVVDAIIKAAVDAGYHLEVEGEEEEGVDTSDVSALKALLFNLDEAIVLVFNGKGKKAFGWIRLVFGNDGWDLVSNHSVNLEKFLEPVQAVADFWGD